MTLQDGVLLSVVRSPLLHQLALLLPQKALFFLAAQILIPLLLHPLRGNAAEPREVSKPGRIAVGWFGHRGLRSLSELALPPSGTGIATDRFARKSFRG